jgi:hypothetical protein
MVSGSSPEPRIEKLLVAGLRGFCAGVVRAIDVVEKALDVCDGPVYVRKEIIHNRYVVDELRSKGAHFVEEVHDVPDGAWLIYSAHGVSPEGTRERAAEAAAHDRRDLPARDEGPPRGDPLREAGIHDHPDRPRGARRDDRDSR